MLQILQYQKTGEILIEEIPMPSCHPEGILVRTSYSLISAGTEKTSVTNAQGSLLDRAKKQPEQVRQVFDFVKKEGLVSTFERVKNKLDSYKVLGYSASGIVIESRCQEFAVGDRVACGGAGFANHAEIISIPKNLAVKIPDNVLLEDAAYTTLASIAMQGVRQADVRLGETIAVIGLGLLGQLTVQLLKSSGCRVIGLDIDETLFERAKTYGCDETYMSNNDSIKSIEAFTRGLGCDSVIITASTSSDDPILLAMKLARKKGKIIIVGAIGMKLQRSPFYEKELDIRISCSYGPGRYDSNYEILGHDYPANYVRWTENRNMQSFLDLLAEKKIDVKTMTTHVFDVKEAVKAYNIITGKTEETFLGILIKYDEKADADKRTIIINDKFESKSEIKIGFIGAGNFAQNYLIPPLKEINGIDLVGVSTSTPVNAISAAKKFGFAISSTDSSELIQNPDINTIFCATRHDSHSKYVIEAIKANKPVFVEKPLAVDYEQLKLIDEAMSQYKGRLMVGFNRRFSKSFAAMAQFFESRTDPMIISYRVNAGAMPPTHWIFSIENRGRIIGEVCHFIDCMVFLTNSLPLRVYAETISTANKNAMTHDNIAITIKFQDGSIGIVQYFANGDSSLPKEYCEVFCEGSNAIMYNFLSVELIRNGKAKRIPYDGKKGHRKEMTSTIEAIRKGKPMPIPYEQIRAVTLTTFAAEESLARGTVVEINYKL